MMTSHSGTTPSAPANDLLATFDVTDRSFETEDAYLSLFVELKERGAFNRKRQVLLKVRACDYARAHYNCSYHPNPARIVVCDYELLIDC